MTTTREFDFKEAPTSLREALRPKRGLRINNPVIQELVKGKTLFIEGESEDHLTGFYESARRLGHKLSMRKISVNEVQAVELDVPVGTIGHVLWFKDLEDSVDAND